MDLDSSFPALYKLKLSFLPHHVARADWERVIVAAVVAAAVSHFSTLELNVKQECVYRTVIDEVITAIKPEFDEYGVSEEILAELQHKWESKVMASNVADFETPPPSHPPPPPPPQHSYTALPHQHPQYSHYPYAPAGGVKTEPVDNRYMLSGPPPLGSYALPPLPGPQLNGAKSSPSLYPSGPPASSFPAGSSGRPPVAPPARQFAASPVEIKPNIKNQQQRIPQVDGPSSSSSGSLSPPPKHSSSPLPPAPSNASTSLVVDDEAINSDLDDSSTEGDEDAEESAVGETDIVFCTYDKVARVKNKWKCILKDGMIHINGRDYLFAKCTGEFEW